MSDPFPGHDRFRGWLVIPYLNREGKALTMRFRCLSSHNHRDFGHGKYMSITGEPGRVYGVDSIHKAADTIHVAEGEMDRMILDMALGPACAIAGARAWKNHHRRMLAGFQHIYVWGDPDDAGAEFIQRVTRALPRAKGVRLRGGDVNDTFLAGGADALRALIK